MLIQVLVPTLEVAGDIAGVEGIGPHGHAEFVAGGQNVYSVFLQLGFQIIGRHSFSFTAGFAAFHLRGTKCGHVLLEGTDRFRVVQVFKGSSILGAQARCQEEGSGKGQQHSLHHSLIKIQLSGGHTPCPRSFLRVARVSLKLLEGHTATARRPFRKLMMVAV